MGDEQKKKLQKALWDIANELIKIHNERV